ncbi:MAG TPA: hypothetical protein VIH43_10035 [Chthoniobacterales bacterium]
MIQVIQPLNMLRADITKPAAKKERTKLVAQRKANAERRKHPKSRLPLNRALLRNLANEVWDKRGNE